MLSLTKQKWTVWALVCAIVFTQFAISLMFQSTSANAYSNTLEAENQALNNGATKNTDHKGYSGSGFVDNLWKPNAEVVFKVSTQYSGDYNMTLRYANGNDSWRSMTIYVNGNKIRSTNLPNTSSWDTWTDKVEQLSLIAGDNVIAIKKEVSDNGGINLDYANFTDTNVSSGSKQVTVYYRGNFTNPYIHYKKDNVNWTTEPGDKMAGATDAFGFYKAVIYTSADDLELTFNNGRDNTGNVSQWDRNNGQNYKYSGVTSGSVFTFDQGTGLKAGSPNGVTIGNGTSKTVTLYYKGNFTNPYIHFRLNAAGSTPEWTVQPGTKLNYSTVYPGYYSATITVYTPYLECVFNNGSINGQVGGDVREWDKNNGANYFAQNIVDGQSYTYESGNIRSGLPNGGGNSFDQFNGTKQVTVYYKGHFTSPYIHYRLQNANSGSAEWSNEPGTRMSLSEITGYSKAIISTSADNLEVVFNNGLVNGKVVDWDRNNGANYVAANVFNGSIYTYDESTKQLTIGDPNGVLTSTTDSSNTINIFYKKNASVPTPYIFYRLTYNNVVNSPKEPGYKMAESNYNGYVKYTLTLPPGVSTVEAAFNNGLENGIVKTWDRPANDNYFLLQAGYNTIADDEISRSIPNVNNISTEATVYYKTKFKNTYLYYKAQNGLWVSDPGVKMDDSEYLGYTKYTFKTGAYEQTEVRFTGNNSSTNLFESDPPSLKDSYIIPTGIVTLSGTNEKGITTIEDGKILAGKPKSGNEITVYYKKGLTLSPYLLYRVSTNNWNQQPGLKMTDTTEYPGYSKVTFNVGDAKIVDAAFNDGTGKLDDNKSKYYQLPIGVNTVSDGEVAPGLPTSGNKVTLYFNKTGFDAPLINYRTPEGVFLKEAKFLTQSDITGYYKIDLNVGSASKIIAYFTNGADITKMDDNSGKYYEFPVGLAAIYTLSNGTITLNKPTSATAGNEVTVYFKQGNLPISFVSRKPGATKWNDPIQLLTSEFTGYGKVNVKIGADNQLEGYFTDGTTKWDNSGSNYTFSIGTQTFSNGLITQGAPSQLTKNEIVVYYKTGIATPYIFYKPQGGIWTSGEIMAPSEVQGYSVARLNLSSASQADIYFNNGGVLDNFNGKNYTLQVGTYTINNSNITLSAPTAANTNKVTVYYKLPQNNFTFLYYRLPGGVWSTTGIPIISSDVAGYGKADVNMGSADRVEMYFDQGNGSPIDNYNNQNYSLTPGTSTIEDSTIYQGKPTGQGNQVTIYYAQGFLSPFVYYRTGTNDFNKAPGLPMQDSEYKGFKKVTFSIGRASQVEVYFQNSNGRIDNNTNKNYTFAVGTSVFSEGSIIYGQPSEALINKMQSGNTTPSLDLTDMGTDLDLFNNDNTSTIYYKRGYTTPYVQYRVSGGQWSVAPGKKMSTSEFAGYSKVTLPIGTADEVQIRFSNGNGMYSNAYYFSAGMSTFEAGKIYAGTPTKAATTNYTATIYYKRGYTTPYAYYQPTDGSWLALPGKKMVVSEIAGYSKITISLGKLLSIKVKIGDGKGKWFKSGTYYRFYKGINTFVNGEITEGKPTAIKKSTTTTPKKKTTTTTTKKASVITKN